MAHGKQLNPGDDVHHSIPPKSQQNGCEIDMSFILMFGFHVKMCFFINKHILKTEGFLKILKASHDYYLFFIRIVAVLS